MPSNASDSLINSLLPSLAREWVMAARPKGPFRAQDFMMVSRPLPSLKPGEFMVRTLFLSLAPVMRQYMIDGAGIEAPLQIGDVIHGRGVGQVVKSANPLFSVGELVHGKFGWREYALVNGSAEQMIYRVRAHDLPPSTALSVLGVTGFSAYVGLFEIGDLKAGQTVLVTGAAGGVGSIVGQLARIVGGRVIGLAGGQAKCDVLTGRLGFDVAIDYREPGLTEALALAAPEGIDVIFDNVGGEVLDHALSLINRHARIVSCGRISQYLDGPSHALANWWKIGECCARMEGFFIYEHRHRFSEAEARMADWIRAGKLTWLEDVLEGFEQMPIALARLFERQNLGKQIVHVADPLDLKNS